MTEKFDELRSSLESEREHLNQELAQLKASAPGTNERREGSPYGKREEEATETAELETRLEMERRIKEQLNTIEHALDKFDKGTYGLCDVCGKPIALPRLEALPYASLCLDCKAGQAKNAKAK
ncbi:MAG: TraR/DksA C4-type zinc finger protein [Dehalococcoidales bacterium]